MNSSYKKLLLFAKSVQKRVVIQRIVTSALFIATLFAFFTSALNCIFAFTPYLLLSLLWDIAAAAFILSLIWIILHHSFLKKPSIDSVIKNLEKQSGIHHPLTSLALEIKGLPENIFTAKTIELGTEQTSVLEKHFPPVLTSLKPFLLFCISATVLCISFLFSSNAVQYWNTPFLQTSNQTNYTVLPGTITVAENKSVKLSVSLKGSIAPSCRLLIKSLAGNPRGESHLLLPLQNNSFEFIIDSVKSSFTYQFIYGVHPVNTDTVTVMPPPSLHSLNVTVKPPAYTGISTRTLISGQGDFSSYYGSEISLQIGSGPLRKAFIVLGHDTIPMSVAGTKASAGFTLRKPTSYSFLLVDSLDQKNDSTADFTIGIIPDEPPAVQLVVPGFNKNLSTAPKEPVAFEAIDDFGISSIHLHWFKSSDPDTLHGINLSPSHAQKQYKGEYLWDLNNCNLYPGDTLFYFIAATDNCPYKPSHTARSDTFWFRIPGFDEIHQAVTQKEKHAESLIRDVKNRNESTLQSVNEMAQDDQNKAPSWEQIQLLDNIGNAFKMQSDSLKTALDELSESAEQLRNQGAIGDELAEKMDQIQKMVEKLIDQYGDSLFTSIDKNQPLSMKDMQDAIKKAQDMLPDISSDLDNTLQYLEALKQDKQLATLAMKAENLAREQNQLSNATNSEQSRNHQNNLLNETQKLNKEIADELDNEKQQSIDKLTNQLNTLSNNMKQKLNSGTLPEQSSMNSMSQSLMSLSDQLQNMMSSAQMLKMEKDRRILLELAYDLLSLDTWQHAIADLPENELKSRKTALLIQVMYDASQKVKFHSDSLRMLPPQIMQHIERQFSILTQSIKKLLSDIDQFTFEITLEYLSNTTLSLANDLLSIASSQGNQQNNSGGSDGMMSGLRKLSKQQAGINAATSELLRSLLQGQKGNKPGESGMSSGEQQQLEKARQAAQNAQKKIADELDRLQKEYGNEAENQQIARRLDELKKDAERIAQMLASPQQEISEKQNQFLNRMLQSALSMNKRDEEKEERKSESAKSVFNAPGKSARPLTPSTPDAFYQLKRRALQGVFPENYRSAVNAYLDSLGAIYLKETSPE